MERLPLLLSQSHHMLPQLALGMSLAVLAVPAVVLPRRFPLPPQAPPLRAQTLPTQLSLSQLVPLT